MTGLVPEPDQKEESEIVASIQVNHPSSSSDDDSADDGDLPEGDMNGYQPLTLLQNEEDDAELQAPAAFLLNMDRRCSTEVTDEGVTEERREIPIDEELVLNAMKGISLTGNCIPPWAKELSDSEWDNIVKRTINGDVAIASENNNLPSNE